MPDGSGFEVMQSVEPAFGPGESFSGTIETRLGIFESEADAISKASNAWATHRQSDVNDVAWWIVRVPGGTLARWIADSRSMVPRVLDLRTSRLVEVEAE